MLFNPGVYVSLQLKNPQNPPPIKEWPAHIFSLFLLSRARGPISLHPLVLISLPQDIPITVCSFCVLQAFPFATSSAFLSLSVQQRMFEVTHLGGPADIQAPNVARFGLNLRQDLVSASELDCWARSTKNRTGSIPESIPRSNCHALGFSESRWGQRNSISGIDRWMDWSCWLKSWELLEDQMKDERKEKKSQILHLVGISRAPFIYIGHR